MSDLKVYYGEYSLAHWIELILKGDIILPEYQRSFVWENENSLKLINSFEENLFIPPVTIGYLKESKENIIIDGQQRLTSIFLYYLGIFPNKDNFKKINEDSSEEENNQQEDSSEEENNQQEDSSKGENNQQEQSRCIIEWTLKELTSLGRTRKEILEEVRILDKGKDDKEKKYKDICENMLNEEQLYEFLKDHYLGFSYTVPSSETDYFYAQLFNNINSAGVKLTNQESRKSLYYLNKDLIEWFSPNCVKNIIVNNKNLDFVRILSIVSQYAKSPENIKICNGHIKSDKLEEYYREYIMAVIEMYNKLEQSDKFAFIKNIDKIEQNEELKKEIKIKLDKLEKNFNEMNLNKTYQSIIDSDIDLFGLLYYSLFEEKNEIIKDKKESIIDKLENKKHELNQNENMSKKPNTNKHIKQRLKDSIEIYEELFK